MSCVILISALLLGLFCSVTDTKKDRENAGKGIFALRLVMEWRLNIYGS